MNTSALNILSIAESGKWVRIVSTKKHYRHSVSKKTFDEVPPKFSDRSFDELVNISHKDRTVTTLDAPRNLGRSGEWKHQVSTNREIVCNSVVFVDSEFDAKKGQGEFPGPPVCICAIEIDQEGRETHHRLAAPYPARAPWDRGDPFLTVGFALSAEAGSFLHVKWPFPVPAIDLYAEYMVLHNTEMSRSEDGKQPGPALIQACQRYGAAGMDKAYKEDMRALAYTKTDHTLEEITLLQNYRLNDDCRMVVRLFGAMLPYIDLLRAPIRGAFMMEIERMRWAGIPIDMPTYRRTERWAPAVASKMREELNRKLGDEVYLAGVFKRRTMFQIMRRNGIPIPVDPKTGKLSCATKLIKNMIETYPPLKEYYEDKRMIDALKNLKLEIGADGRMSGVSAHWTERTD